MYDFQASRNDAELPFQFLEVIVTDCFLRLDQSGKRWGCAGFDRDVHRNKPFFVDPAEEILQQRDIAERNGSLGINPFPVIQSVRSIGEHRGTTQLFRYFEPGDCERGWDLADRVTFPPHIAVTNKG